MKRSCFFLAAIIGSLLLTGCGGSDKGYSVMSTSADMNTAVDNVGMAGDFSYADYAEEAISEYEYDGAASVQEAASGVQTVKRQEEKLVYTCSLQIETLEYAETINFIKGQISAYHGIIQSEHEWDDNNAWYRLEDTKASATMSGSLTVRIPSSSYNDFLDSLSGSGKIKSKDSSVENISASYYETATIVDALKVQEQRLLSMMEAAETIEGMILVEERLTEVQTQLNVYHTQLSAMDTDVYYSTIYINVNEVFAYTPEPEDDTFLQRLGDEVVDSWYLFWELLEGLLFLLIRLIPVAVIAIPVLIFLNWIRRKICRKPVFKKSIGKGQDSDSNTKE